MISSLNLIPICVCVAFHPFPLTFIHLKIQSYTEPTNFDCKLHAVASTDFPTIKYISRNDGTSRGGSFKGFSAWPWPSNLSNTGWKLFRSLRGHPRQNWNSLFQLARNWPTINRRGTGVPLKNQWPIQPESLRESGRICTRGYVGIRGSRRGSIVVDKG